MVRPLGRMTLRLVTAATAAATAFAVIPAPSAVSKTPDQPSLGLSGATAPAEAPQSVIQPSLAQHLTKLEGGGIARVMVQSSDGNTAARDAIRAAGLVPGVRMDRIGINVATGTAPQIRALSLDPRVSRLDWADEKVDHHVTSNHRATRAETVHSGAFDVDGNGSLDAFQGAGFSVAIVDSGTDGLHPMFADESGDSRVKKNIKIICSDEVAGTFDYATVDECAVDATATGNDTDSPSAGGHGTHVTGIAAGSIVTDTTGRELRGGAPQADIVAVSTGASVSVFAGTVGLYWVLKHHADPCGDGSCAPIVAVNNSWGPPGGGPFEADAPNSVVQRALVEEGVVVVWAAGNDGGDGTDNVTNPPGADPTLGVLSVANYDDAGTASRDNALDPSSSRGKAGDVSTYPDLSAPGHLITSACRPQLTICATGLETADPNYNTISGTSMAAPHIAGYVAVLQEVALRKLNRRLTPAEVETLLVDTAHQFGSRTYAPDTRNPASTTGTSFDAGHGLVDLAAAVAQLTGLAEPPVAGAVCDYDARFTDPAGDATGAFGNPTPLPNADGLDVVESWLSTDKPTSDVTFHIKVADLAESPGGGTEGAGEYFDYNFTLGGAGYYLGAERTGQEGETFVLGKFETTRTTLASGLPGTFDPTADEVRVTLPAAKWAELGLPGAVAAGQQIAGLNIVSRRQLGAVVPDADAAAGGCAYTIGGTPASASGATGGLNHPPKIHKVKVRSLKGKPKSLRAGVRVRFRAVATDADSDRIRYRWWFGDGTRAKGAKHAHRYTEPGVYKVKLRVRSKGRLTYVKRFKVVIGGSRAS